MNATLTQNPDSNIALSPESNRPRDIKAHTGLRGLAAVLVLVAHLKLDEMYSAEWLTYIHRFIYWQGQSVDLFFMLSGFVLCHVYGFQANFSWRKYIVARVARIYPLVLLALVALLSLDLYSLVRHGISTTFLEPETIAINALLLNGLQDTWVHKSPNPPSWSVSVEMALYIIVFPALILLFRSLSNRLKHLPRYITIVSVGLMMGGYSVLHFGEFSWLARGVFGFTCGFAIRHWIKNQKTHRTVLMESAIGFLAITVMIGILATGIPHYALLPFLAIIVYITYSDTNVVSRALSQRWCVYLGERSYSIYMLHHLMIQIAYRILLYPNQLASGAYPFANRVITTMAVLSGTLVLAELSYRFFECPVRDMIRRQFAAKAA